LATQKFDKGLTTVDKWISLWSINNLHHY
jgi:hypothetical protein